MSDLERKFTKIEIPTLNSEKDAFRERIIGQDEAVEAFATLLAKLRSGIRQQRPGPLDIKFLPGPSGVGKTEMVYTFAELLAEEDDNPRGKVIKINGGEYQEGYSLSRLLGSPPGYIGSEDSRWPGGTKPIFSQENLDSHKIFYTDKTGQRRDVTIVLIDEAEKAHDNLHRAFLSVLDKGQMDLANNTSVDFSETVIFYTSNVGNQQIEQVQGNMLLGQGDRREIVADSFRNAFPPEFRGRIKEIIIFNNLNEEAIKRIAVLKIRKVEQDFANSRVKVALELSPKALEWLIAQGYNLSEGARALEKVVEHSIYDKLVLAHVGINIHRRKIYIDLEDGEPELGFYFNEGEELSDFSTEKVDKGFATTQIRSSGQEVVSTAQEMEISKPAVAEPLPQTQETEVRVVKANRDDERRRRILFFYYSKPDDPSKPHGPGVVPPVKVSIIPPRVLQRYEEARENQKDIENSGDEPRQENEEDRLRRVRQQIIQQQRLRMRM